MNKLGRDDLFRACDPEHFEFETTMELEDVDIVGQPRAVDAIRFGIGIEQEGFNLFAMGPSGVGKHHVVARYLEQRAREQRVPRAWCYVHNFDEPRSPKVISFPPGRATAARRAVEKLISDVEIAVQSVFEGEDFRARRRAIHHEFDRRQEEALQAINDEGREEGVALTRTQEGFVLAPIVDGELVAPEKIDDLPEEEQERLDEVHERLSKRLRATLDDFPRWDRERRDRIRKLQRESTSRAVEDLFDAVREDFADADQFVEHLDRVQEHVAENPDPFLTLDEQEEGPPTPFEQPSRQSFDGTEHYIVNVLVDHGDDAEGAPIVYEDDPTVENLLGTIDYEAQYGALFTNFSLIRSGSLHRANGGYLVVDARKLLSNPRAWSQFKRTLYAQEIRVEAAHDGGGIAPTTLSLKPDPIPLVAKIVLIGERETYYALTELDPDMDELFKVMADFESEMERTPESVKTYARLVATLGRRDDLAPFDCGALARIIEQSARIARDSDKLTTHMRTLADLLREADYWRIHDDDEDIVSARHVQRAIDKQEERNGRIRDRIAEQIRDGLIVIRTDGTEIGQVNGLSVIRFGQSSFGRPTRISATATLGNGEVVDIEREVDLGGPIHSKGILILKGFLSDRFAVDHPLSLSASIVFEQSYSGVDGDSASAAEACALLSSIAEVPLKQSMAITGAIDQRGAVQAVGGVNEKVEGFFDVCSERGLTGEQGVILPTANVAELMLRGDVVQAVENEDFHVWAIDHIDEALELLTDQPAEDVASAVTERLGDFARRVRAFRSDVEH